MSRYLIGIDLGTTNCALAYVDTRQRGVQRIHTLPVTQLVAPAEVADRSLLPSFLYLPGAHDLPPGACAVPWDQSRGYAVGEFARNHGARVPGRLVTSAKSWLCHAGVDRSSALLPWSAPPEVQRVSPVEASATYLRHLADVWNYQMARTKPEDAIEHQEVVLTVPASFDDVARNLTVEAARKAGIERLTLLEEPQAAFYCWLAANEGTQIVQVGSSSAPASSRSPVLTRLRPGMVCLVLDVGGGTSDFSLIQAVEQQGDMAFVRQAVGDHLLLGGDNMDLALAKHIENKLPKAGRLDAATLGQLTQACRVAKETLLAPTPPPEFTVTVMGRGRAVVGGAMHANLSMDEVRKVLFDGFFPVVDPNTIPSRTARAGLHEMGLPYVSDPGVTRHLAAFLIQHGISPSNPPDAILFNGGVFQPASVRERLLEVMRHWYDTPARPWQPLVLTSASLDLAVAWGAAHYSWLRHSGGKRIAGGLARSYYVGVRRGVTSEPAPDRGQPVVDGKQRTPVLCIVPQHLQEGQEITLEEPELELALGQPVTFPLFTSTVRGDDRPGQMLELEPRQLLRLPPLHTILRGGKRSGARSVPVKLAARLTEIGTLELFCVAKQGDNRWRLEFNTREIVKGWDSEFDAGETLPEPAPSTADPLDVWPEAKVQAAGALIRMAYATGDEGPPRELVKSLEEALEASRQNWPTGLCRRLWDFLAEVASSRGASPTHLGRWYNLVGYCLRPGFGDSLDRFRVEQLWKVLHSLVKPSGGPGGVEGRKQASSGGGADHWIMWRRVSGGLNASLQQSLLDRLRPILLPARSGKGAAYKPGPNELAEMWRAAASLERIDVRWKEQLGQALLKPLRRSPVPTYGFWSLTRLGSRVLLYGPLNTIVHPQIVQGWITAILAFQPENENERLNWLFCLSQLARRTHQRALDVDDDTRGRVAIALHKANATRHLVQMVEEGGELEMSEQKQFFGDALPIGLRLVRDAE